MPDIIIYVDPSDDERDERVRLAADLVEFMSSPLDSGHQALGRIGIVADVADCLEIGLATLGRGQARTVEGGDRTASNVALFPFDREAPPEGDAGRAAEWTCLEELAHSGAVEGIEVGLQGGRSIQSEAGVVNRALTAARWEVALTLGPGEALNRALVVREGRPRRLALTADAQLRERIPSLLHGEAESPGDSRPIRERAVLTALRFQWLVQQLDLR